MRKNEDSILCAIKLIPKYLLGLFIKKQPTIKLYYYKYPKGKPNHLNGKLNFGDYLSDYIVAGASKKKVTHTPVEKTDYIAIGSIMNFLDHTSHKVKVWGSGHMYQEDLPVRNKKIEILALRGYLSLAKYPDLNNIPLGDPALLTSKFINPVKQKVNKIGVIPHYVDKGDPRIQALENDPRFMLIDVFDSPITVAKDISSCTFVVSSSLHGIIVAHSYLIPAAWIELSDKVLGDGFKFEDYFSVFNVQPNKVAIEEIIKDPFNEKHYFSPKESELSSICDQLIGALNQG